MASLLTQFKAAGRITLYLAIAFFAVKLWQDPAGSANATVNFVDNIGGFFASLIDKIGAFVKGLGS